MVDLIRLEKCFHVGENIEEKISLAMAWKCWRHFRNQIRSVLES